MPKLVPPSDVDNMVPVNILQEQGVSASERFTVKNLARNPEAAKQYLSSLGYEVRDLKTDAFKLNFAVRKHGQGPWRVVDPKGFDSEDVLDLTSDILFGIPIAIGAALGGAAGPAGAIGGAALGAAAFEGARQVVGSSMGVPDNFSAKDVAIEGAAGGVAQGVAPIISAAAKAGFRSVRGAGRLAVDLSSRISSTTGTDLLRPRDITLARASMAGFNQVMDSNEGAKALLKKLRGVRVGTKLEGGINDAVFPEKQLEQALLKEASESIELGEEAISVSFREIFENLRGLVPAKRSSGAAGPKSFEALTADIAEGDVGKSAAKFLVKLENDLAFLGISPDNIPLIQANEIKRALQRRALLEGAAFGPQGAQVSTFATEIRNAASRTRDIISTKMAGAAQQIAPLNPDKAFRFGQFKETTDLLWKKTRRMKALFEALNFEGDDAAAEVATTRFLETLYTNSSIPHIEALADIEKLFGLGVGSLVTAPTEAEAAQFGRKAFEAAFRRRGSQSIAGQVTIAQNFGHRGAPETLARFTAAGNILGPSILAGGGAFAFGPLGFLGGAALASPKIQLGLVKGGMRVGSIVYGAERRLNALALRPEMRAAGLAALREGASRSFTEVGVAREGQTARERPVVSLR